ncbi:DUF1064 domain-containing protein [Campylobacter sp. RM16191]|uniref:DUF1064 domain-containing protein n=1 Tax=Campylobacter sp. RM16191 TaxID=1705728 RepID=UPI0014748D03|nr:DUF1064 domain-containing protein [Campylobacter sp. RM16191]
MRIGRSTKYHNTKIHGYDSKKEYLRSLQLKDELKKGRITELKEQVVFTLQDSFKIRSGKTKSGYATIKAITYKADFTYFKGGVYYIEDTKGFKTKDYRLKAKMLRKLIADGKIDAVFVES